MKNPTYRIKLLTAALGMTLAAGAFAGDTAVSQDVLNARRESQIWTSYAFNPHLRALDISVEVHGDHAVLVGTVDNAVEKNLAEQIAMGVKGISKVDNQLKIDSNYVRPVRTLAAGEREYYNIVEDATITASVKSKLLWNDNTDGMEINVDTLGGKVTLNGTADTPATRDLAGRLARNTSGVIAVDNKLTIDKATANPPTVVGAADVAISDSWITGKVKSTLLLSRWVDGLDINVDTTNGVVSLSGYCDSTAEKELAIDLSQSIRGVKKVDASGLKVG